MSEARGADGGSGSKMRAGVGVAPPFSVFGCPSDEVSA